MNTERTSLIAVGITMLALIVFSTPGGAAVDINVDINVPLPPVVFRSPPLLVPIPDRYVYFVPDVDVDILFYQGFWYRPYQGRWYRARSYRGPWDYLTPSRVPRVFIELPPDYRHLSPPGHRKIPYGELNRNWKKWEREKYWDRHERQYEREGDRGERGNEGRGKGRR